MSEKYDKIVKLWKSHRIQSSSDLDVYLNNFRVLFAYHSGRIENMEITYHDTREIFEDGKVSGYSGGTRAIFEQQNQKLCYEYLKEKIVSKEPISIELIKEIHRILTSGTYDETRYIQNGERPGAFKVHDYVTGIHEVGSAPEDVEADLTDLLEELLAYGTSKPLVAGAYFHARFEYIHPFADGNGRVGRTLLNYFFMINGHPPVIIYDEDKKIYYAALEAYDRSEELEPMVSFLQQQTEKTWTKTLERSEKSKEGFTR